MPTMTTRHRQLNLIIQRVPIVPGNPFDPFNSGPTEGAPVKVWGPASGLAGAERAGGRDRAVDCVE